MCSYYPSDVEPPRDIAVYSGNGSVFGYLGTLFSCWARGPFDVVHAHAPRVALLFLFASLFSGDARQTHTVYTLHGSFNGCSLRDRLVLLPVFWRFNTIVCCGDASFQSIPPLFRRIAGERLRVISNGVDIEQVDHTTRLHPLPLYRPELTVISVGRLERARNPFVILHAFAQLEMESSRLVFVGDGPLETALWREAKTLGIAGRVVFMGAVERREVYDLMADADVFVSSSHTEGLPVAVLEAMACRKPVILSDIPSHREIAGDIQGMSFPRPNDIDAFAAELRRFERMGPAQRRALGNAGRALVESSFDLNLTRRKYDEVYEDAYHA